jgi:hypothetical protein
MKYPDVQKIIDILESIKAGEATRGFDMNFCHHESLFDCDTACCIGGHAAHALNNLNLCVEDALAIFCSIPIVDAHDLCWPGMWKSPKTNNYIHIGCSDVGINDAISHLKSYMETGVVDWTPYAKRDSDDE